MNKRSLTLPSLRVSKSKLKPVSSLVVSFPIFPPAQVAPQRFLVRGKHADNNEYNFSLALDMVGLNYLFQVSYWGGHTLPGGVVLDFLVFTVPLYTPVFVNGDYWHSGQRRAIDLLQIAIINDALRGQARQVVEEWGQDTDTFEAALRAVKKDIV